MCWAADPIETSEEEPDWYDVEVIVFRHHDFKALSQENWARDPGSPMIRTARELLPPLPETLSSVHSEKLKGPVPYLQLREDSYQLQDKFDQLLAAKDYEPLLHISWRQPGLGPDDAEAVHIHGNIHWRSATETADTSEGEPLQVATELSAEILPGEDVEGPPAPFVDGTIKLIRKRFLHIEADFLYRAPFIEDKENLLARQQWPQAFRLQETRRMRSREIHYLDHPMFGVLITATPYVAPVLKESTEVVPGAVKGKNSQLGGQTPPKASNPLSGTIRR